jgi:hypothetical protein
MISVKCCEQHSGSDKAKLLIIKQINRNNMHFLFLDPHFQENK